MLSRTLAGVLTLLTLAGCSTIRQPNHLLPPAPEPPRVSSLQQPQPRDEMQTLAPTPSANTRAIAGNATATTTSAGSAVAGESATPRQ